MLKKELKRLVLLGIWAKANESEWGSPYFSKPKSKTNRVQFLSDFGNLNRQIKRKPSLMHKISEIILKFKCFTYHMSLDLNIIYYNIILSKYASNLCTIVLPWVKYRHKRLPMGVGNFPNIFKRKLMNYSKGFNLYVCI